MPEGARARQAAWLLTLTATASAAGGDTLRARALVDSIEQFGARSGFRRDPLLHHFVGSFTILLTMRCASAT